MIKPVFHDLINIYLDIIDNHNFIKHSIESSHTIEAFAFK